MTDIGFEVEQVALIARDLPIVLARRLSPQEFTIIESSTLGGCCVAHSLDATRWTSAAAFHEAVRSALSFPEHYANNLASWIDSLSELDVPDEGGALLVFRGYDIFARAEPALAQIVLDSIESASRRFL